MKTPAFALTFLFVLTAAAHGLAQQTPAAGQPPQRETITLHQTYRPNRPLLYTGGAMFLAAYGPTVAIAGASDVKDGSGDHTLYIPVAGPWMHLAVTNESDVDTFLIASSGALQGAGVLLSVLSVIIPEKVPTATIQAGGAKFTITPASYGRGAAGIGAVGQF
jgi:hypothetical protein